MSHSSVSRVDLTDALIILQAMARARDAELAAGRRVVGLEIDEATHALFRAARGYCRTPGPLGWSVLNLPVVVGSEPGWRLLSRE